MGKDDQTIKLFLGSGKDFKEPICRRSYGVAVDEPLAMTFDRSRRQYIFNVRAWTEQDVLPFKQGQPHEIFTLHSRHCSHGTDAA